MGSSTSKLAALLAACLLLTPILARADWTLYVQGNLGVATAETSVAGTPPFTGAQPFDGRDRDSAPALGGAIGLAIPLAELAPWDLPFDLRMPNWTFRFENEALGLRNFQGTFQTSATGFRFTESEGWSLMWNAWQEVPLQILNRPIAAVLGRTPRFVKRALGDTAWYFGLGIGVAGIDYATSDTVTMASYSAYNFAWQAGTGFSYRLTKAVSLDLGYRYFDGGSASSDLADSTNTAFGPLEIDQTSHEVWTKLRVRIFSFQDPWRRWMR